MRKQIFPAFAALLLSAVACTSAEKTAVDDSSLPALPHDIHSYAQPGKARVTNVSLDLTPDFAAKRIDGIAKLTVTKSAGADSIVLDVRDLDIKSVKDVSGAALGFNIGPAKEFLAAARRGARVAAARAP